MPVKMYPLSNAIIRHHLWDSDSQGCPSIWTGIFLCSQGSLSETAYHCWTATSKGFAAFYGQRQWCPRDHGIPPSNIDAATSASDLTFLCFSSQSCETEDNVNSALGDHRKDIKWGGTVNCLPGGLINVSVQPLPLQSLRILSAF